MAKLLMMRGLPASGKTTRALEMMREYGNLVRVNRDQLRPMLHGDAKWTGKKEAVTMTVQRSMVKGLLNDDRSVIVDDTNLRDADRERWSHVARERGAKFEVVDVDTAYEECVDRDSRRGLSRVGQHVVTSMALSSGRFPYKNIVLCDIDGTLADLRHRLHHIEGGKRDWDSFFAEVAKDGFREDVWEQVVMDADEHDARIIFLSGRSEVARDDTEEWLWDEVGVMPVVLMRREYDRRPDTEVKRDI
jgi:predicted kinase